MEVVVVSNEKQIIGCDPSNGEDLGCEVVLELVDGIVFVDSVKYTGKNGDECEKY